MIPFSGGSMNLSKKLIYYIFARSGLIPPCVIKYELFTIAQRGNKSNESIKIS